jgi:hypothetical protein
MNFSDIWERIETRHVAWAVAIAMTCKLAYKHLFPEPRIETTSHYIRFDDEEDWQHTNQEPLKNADFRYSEILDNDTTTLYRKSRYIYFSTRNRMDLLELVVRGRNLVTATAVFRITQVNGDVIYQISAPARQALCPAYVTNLVAQEEMIRYEINHFFDHSNMLQPALATNELYDPRVHLIDSLEYQALYYDDQVNGFMLHSFTEHGQRVKLCFSRRKNKVITYYKCCSNEELEFGD